MSLEQTIDNLQIRNANMVTFVGTSNTMVDTTTGRIQTKGIQHNSNVITDVSGPHGRGVATLKKYPDIIFEKEKFEYNNSSNTYSQAGYTVSVSSQDANLTNDERGIVYYMFDGAGAGPYDNQWTSASASNYGAGTFNNTNAHYQIAATDVDGATIPHGEWIKLKMPKKIRLERVFLQPNLNNMTETPEDFKIYGSNDGTTWKLLITQTGMVPRDAGNDIVPATTISGYYDEYAIVITKIYNNAQPDTSIEELEFYGYEEDPPAGDHSVDTTFKSRFNNAQTTGVQVLVDGATGVGTNQISGGPDPSGNQSTYVTDGKYWTLNGTLTSNLSVEANTFLEGDQPHAVSVWFNSSNLEANVSNTCVFSIASEEKLDSQNLDLQSNTWHNLTYAYQGEGGSRVTYLDGRKVAEDQAEDTFGDYPPFAMTGYSQGGYVVSASSENSSFPAHEAFKDFPQADTLRWQANRAYTSAGLPHTDSPTTLTYKGEWIQLEQPYKLKINYLKMQAHSQVQHQPENWVILGSNDGTIWEFIQERLDASSFNVDSDGYHINTDVIDSQKFYKYHRIVITKSGATAGTEQPIIIGISLYGHRENDLVRLPDPTNVLKYPHIAMTGPAQRGYVASASSTYDENYNPWEAFDDQTSTTTGTPLWGYWSSVAGSFSTSDPFLTNRSGSPYVTSVSGTPYTGEWLQLELPHKLKVNSIKYKPRVTGGMPRTGVVAGSNDGTSWVQIFTYQNLSASTLATATDLTPNSSVSTSAFKYIRIIMTHANGAEYASAQDVQIYGTGVDSIPIQIGGGNIDKVANFRVYDRFIEEDQVNEIWNAQKEEFGRAKPQMVLQQGKLGIGTDAPQGSLSVADEPHNVEEFPPRALTGYKTYIEGHGDFCTSESNVYTSGYESYKAFNKNSTAGAGTWWSQSDAGIVPSYSTSNGTFSYFSYDSQYSTNVEGATKMGHWLQIEFPYKINYRYSDIQAPHHSIGRQPRAGYILGSNDLTGMWTSLHNFTNVTRTHAYESVRYTPPTVSTQTFKYFRLVIEELNGDQYAGIARWDIFGTREQGQSILHDGQLTLTKSLNVPRIGPVLDADDTPRRDRLVVEYNTSTNPTFEGAVRDTSGRGNDGRFYGDATYDAADKMITLSNGTDDYVESGKTIIARGTPQHTFSFWIKPSPEDLNDSNTHYVMVWGSETAQNKWSGIALSNTGRLAHVYHASGKRTVDQIIPTVGSWYHVAVVVNSTTATTASSRDIDFYVNGELYTGTYDTLGSQAGSTSYYLDWGHGTHTSVRLGSLHAASEDSSSSLSTIKLYDYALTASDVKILYDMGRMGGKVNPQPLHIDTPVHINAPLYAPGTILNISQFVDSTSRTVSNNNSTIQTGYTTPAVPMKAGSKVKLEFHIPYRQDGGSGWKGGYHWIYFRLNKTVAGVAANTWVFLLTSGYHMDHASSVISNYSNSCYLPLSVPEDFTIEFQHRWRPYENTSEVMYINGGHHINITTDSNLLDLGFAYNNMGWSKYIITEISK